MNLLLEDTSFGCMLDAWLEAKIAEVWPLQSYDYSARKFDSLRSKDIKIYPYRRFAKNYKSMVILKSKTGHTSSRASLKEMSSVSQTFSVIKEH